MSQPFKTKVIDASCKSALTKHQAQRPSRPGFQFGRGTYSWWPLSSRCTVTVNSRRHLVFTTETQLQFLSKVKTWFIDGTFKLCHHTFTQLRTINAYVRCEDHVKQIPLVFVLMSGKKTNDYQKVNMHWQSEYGWLRIFQSWLIGEISSKHLLTPMCYPVSGHEDYFRPPATELRG